MTHSGASIVILFIIQSFVIMEIRGNPIHARRILVDLSYDYGDDTIVWPSLRKFEITDIFNETDSFGVWKADMSFCMPEHAGTHIDAPSHFNTSGWSVDQIPIENFFAPVVKVDISDKVDAGDFDAQLTVDDLRSWEEEHGRIPDGSVVFMHSGWGKHWPNATAYYGDDATNKTEPFTTFHYPGIHPDAAQWLITNRSIVGMGVDSASTDFGRSTHFLTHSILAANNVYGLENVKNVDKLPASGATVNIFPMKIRGGTGAPCRIIAAV